MSRKAEGIAEPGTGAQAAACLGYACVLFASQMTLWGGLPLTKQSGLALASLLMGWSVPLCAAMGCSLVAIGCALACRPFARWKAATYRAVTGMACALLLAGYGLLCLAGGSSIFAVAAGGMAVGVGLGVFLGAYASLFARLEPRAILRLVLGALALCGACQFAITNLAPNATEAAFVVASVLAAGLFPAGIPARCAPGGDEAGAAAGSPGLKALAKRSLEAVWAPLLFAVAIAFSVAMTRMITLAADEALRDSISSLGAACTAAGALALLAGNESRLVRLDENLSLSSLFRILFPVLATLLLALSIGGAELGLPIGALVFAAYAILSALMVPACAEANRSGHVPFELVYGLFAGLVQLAFAVATMLGVALILDGGGLDTTAAFLMAVLIMLYILAMAFVLGQRKPREKTQTTPAAPPEVETGQKAAPGVSDDGAAGGLVDPADAAIEAAETDLIERRCAIVAERYGLSPRETEVLVAFAHGRNVAYLSEKLFLSQNTIRSHSKTLYTKLGIHSKQELIDLVESVDLSPDDFAS